MTGYNRATKSGRALTVSSTAPVRPSGASNSVAAAAATWPPAEAPITPMRSGRIPSACARDRRTRIARSTSCRGAGWPYSARRYLRMNVETPSGRNRSATPSASFPIARRAKPPPGQNDHGGTGRSSRRRHARQHRDLHVVDPSVLDPLFSSVRHGARHALGPERNDSRVGHRLRRSLRRRLLQALRRERFGCDADRMDAPFEPRHSILTNAERDAPRLHRRERNPARKLAQAVYIMGHRAAVVRQGSHVPPVRGVRLAAIDQGQPLPVRAQERVERPPGRRKHAQLDQRSTPGVCRFDVQESLLFGAVRRRLERDLDRESFETRNRIGLDEHAIGCAVELDRRPDPGLDNAGSAGNRNDVTANRRQVVETPDDGFSVGSRRRLCCRNSKERGESQQDHVMHCRKLESFQRLRRRLVTVHQRSES